MVSAFALFVLATMSAVLPAREPVARRVPLTGAELLESRHEWLRPSYFACVDSAGSVEAQEACVDEAFAYQDGELNRVYREKLATLSRRDQNALREIERRWIRQIRSEEHTSELQSLMRISYAVFCLHKKKTPIHKYNHTTASHYPTSGYEKPKSLLRH